MNDEFRLESYLAERRAFVEGALRRILPSGTERPASLSAAMRHAVLLGGKRVRPILCLAAAEAVGGTKEDALPAALAIELLHSYTLVHDDLPCMDNDLVRRGQPTVHAKFGETVALLAGDALQGFAFQMLAATDAPRADVRAMAAELGAAAVGVVRGQVEDLAFAGCADPDTVAYVHLHKTAALFRAAVRMGALAAGAAPETLAKLAVYAENLGLAFQIIDDLLDAGEPREGEDAELTCLSIWSPDDARARAARRTSAAVEALEGLPGPTAPLRALAGHMLERAC
ncbi:MAG: polyprenyl synthetase family protein [Kiritimatiellia bacterium]|jgi:geranylgeranyl diphosphate synthase type II